MAASPGPARPATALPVAVSPLSLALPGLPEPPPGAAPSALESLEALAGLWVDEPGVAIPVEGYVLPGGGLIDGSADASDAVFLTSLFFEESGIPVPQQARPARLWTYRYYPPGSGDPKAGRGSGRDHLKAADLGPATERLKAVKGSGTNAEFSRVNSREFSLADFRRNGLQFVGEDLKSELTGALVEYVMARTLAGLGVPVVPHDRLVLLPPGLQSPRMHGGNANRYAAQFERVLEGRESLGGRPTREEALRLAARLYFHNIGHGAINEENLTSGARIIDLGHVTFGYPLTSGAYRCTICRGLHGSSYDKTMRGVLDHYFGKREGKASYSHRLSRAEATDFIQELLMPITANRFEGLLSPAEARALRKATREELLYRRYKKRAESALYWRQTDALIRAQLELLGVEAGRSSRRPWRPQRLAVPLRLMMQTAALKWMVSPEAAGRARAKLLGLLEERARPDAELLLDLFERLFAEKRARPADLKALFREHLPAGEMRRVVSRELGRVRGFDEALAVLRPLVQRLRRPVEVDPRRFLELLLSLE